MQERLAALRAEAEQKAALQASLQLLQKRVAEERAGREAASEQAQALERALSAAREEAASLAQLREAASQSSAQQMGALQASGWLAGAVVVLPLLQAAYFGLRVLLWLCAALERLGFS